MKKAMILLAVLVTLCLLCTACSGSDGGSLFTQSRSVCGICGGTGVQQIMTHTDPVTHIPQWTTIGCGGCGGAGYF